LILAQPQAKKAFISRTSSMGTLVWFAEPPSCSALSYCYGTFCA
jgi:hypothetical protein